MKKTLFILALLIFGGVAVAAPDPKVVICHKEGNGTSHTIEVAQSAVAAHVNNHGDTVGACAGVGTPPVNPTPTDPVTTGNTQGVSTQQTQSTQNTQTESQTVQSGK